MVHQDDVKAAAGRDADAFERLVRVTQASVCATALAIVHDVGASEEIAQEAYRIAWHDLPKLRKLQRFETWLKQITRNLAFTFIREHRMKPPVELSAALDALPRSTREAVILYYRSGESVRDVATTLGLPEADVEKRMSRARAVLGERMEEVEALRRSAPAAVFAAGIVATLNRSRAAWIDASRGAMTLTPIAVGIVAFVIVALIIGYLIKAALAPG